MRILTDICACIAGKVAKTEESAAADAGAEAYAAACGEAAAEVTARTVASALATAVAEAITESTSVCKTSGTGQGVQRRLCCMHVDAWESRNS